MAFKNQRIMLAERDGIHLMAYISFLAQDRATRRSPAVIDLEIVTPENGIRISPDPRSINSFQFSANIDNHSELVTGGEEALLAKIMKISRSPYEWKFVQARLTVLEGVCSDDGMLNELITLYVQDAHNQVAHIIPAANPPCFRQQFGRIISNAALAMKKITMSPTLKLAWMPYLELPGAGRGCWGIVHNGVVCWTMRETSTAAFWLVLCRHRISVSRVLRGIPLWFEDATITWKGDGFYDHLPEEMQDLETVQDLACKLLEEFKSFDGGIMSSRMGYDFWNVSFDIQVLSEDTLEYSPLEQFRLNGIYRLLHNLQRVIGRAHCDYLDEGSYQSPKMRIRVQCDRSPMKVVISALKAGARSTSLWHAKCYHESSCIRSTRGSFLQICRWVLSRQNAKSSEWRSWFDIYRRRLHIVAKEI